MNFYPSITEKLLKDSIEWARQFLKIEPEDERTILCAKKSLLYNENELWIKKGNCDFDVAQGSFDGAETCELVGLFLLSKISHIKNTNIGIYRDDGLLVTKATPQQAEKIKKEIAKADAIGIQFDESTDISKREMLAIVGKFVKRGQICTRLLEICHVEDLTATGLFKEL